METTLFFIRMVTKNWMILTTENKFTSFNGCKKELLAFTSVEEAEEFIKMNPLLGDVKVTKKCIKDDILKIKVNESSAPTPKIIMECTIDDDNEKIIVNKICESMENSCSKVTVMKGVDDAGDEPRPIITLMGVIDGTDEAYVKNIKEDLEILIEKEAPGYETVTNYYENSDFYELVVWIYCK